MAEKDDNFVENDIESFGFQSMPNIGEDLDFTPTDEIIEVGGEALLKKEEQKSTEEGQESTNKLVLELLKDKIGLNYTDEEFEDTDEYLKMVLEKDVDDKANKIAEEKLNAKLANLPEPVKKLLQYHNDDIDVQEILHSQERLEGYKSVQPTDFDDNKDLQQEVLEIWLSTQNYSKEEIKEELESYEDAGDDFMTGKAKLALKKLIEKETRNVIELQEKADEFKTKRAQAKADNLKKFESDIMAITEITPGKTLTEVEKKKIFEILTKPVGTDKLGRGINYLNKLQMDDPLFLVKTAYYGGVLKWDFSSLKKEANTNALSKLKQNLTTSTQKTNDATEALVAKFRKAMKR